LDKIWHILARVTPDHISACAQVAGLQEQVQGSAAEDRARTALLEVTDLRKTVDRLESEKEEQGEEVERLRGHVAREQGLLVQKEQDLQHHEADLERLGVEAAREDAAREARERQDSDRGSMDRELSVESHGIPAGGRESAAEGGGGPGSRALVRRVSALSSARPSRLYRWRNTRWRR